MPTDADERRPLLGRDYDPMANYREEGKMTRLDAAAREYALTEYGIEKGLGESASAAFRAGYLACVAALRGADTEQRASTAVRGAPTCVIEGYGGHAQLNLPPETIYARAALKAAADWLER